LTAAPIERAEDFGAVGADMKASDCRESVCRKITEPLAVSC
jgi:hypothetical protein